MWKTATSRLFLTTYSLFDFIRASPLPWYDVWCPVSVNVDHRIQNVYLQVVAEIMSSEDCRALDSIYSSTLTDYMLCVRYTEAGRNLCSMLAGSSLVCRHGDRWWQHGFVSWGVSGCASTMQPEVHSNVVKYLPWIERITTGGQSFDYISLDYDFK